MFDSQIQSCLPDHKLEIGLLSPHGLFQGGMLEVGRDSDNGGQIVYVLEKAKALAEHPKVACVHLFTRLIHDAKVAPIYNQEIERINDKLLIRRIPFGGADYLPKEQLWNHLDEFAAKTVEHIRRHGMSLDWLDSHYADAGHAVQIVSKNLGVPFSHTGHSLGRRKLDTLLASGVQREDAFEQYRLAQRFEAEEATLSDAAFVICSSREEVASYQAYKNAGVARFEIVPPGIDQRRFFPHYCKPSTEEEKQARESAKSELGKFLRDRTKPLIVAISRADRKKNILRLVEAYGRNPRLNSLANLAIFMGLRDDVAELPPAQQEIVRQVFLLVDRYDLYGKVAMPKRHSPAEIPALYRLAARSRGAFVNVALTEPFGLTVLEAAASGLPVVATNGGGPSETVERLDNGITVDPYDSIEIGNALLDVLTDEVNWRRRSNLGILNQPRYYSWQAHTERFLQLVRARLADPAPVGIHGSPR